MRAERSKNGPGPSDGLRAGKPGHYEMSGVLP